MLNMNHGCSLSVKHFLYFEYVILPIITRPWRCEYIAATSRCICVLYLFVALGFILRGDFFVCLSMCYFVLVFFQSF